MPQNLSLASPLLCGYHKMAVHLGFHIVCCRWSQICLCINRQSMMQQSTIQEAHILFLQSIITYPVVDAFIFMLFSTLMPRNWRQDLVCLTTLYLFPALFQETRESAVENSKKEQSELQSFILVRLP